jgi:Flp pilus assembly protein TadD
MREARPDGPGRLTSARAIAHYLDARRLSLAGDQAGAVEALRLATAFDERSAELHSALSEALALAGRVDDAEAEARQALVLDPRSAQAYIERGHLRAFSDLAGAESELLAGTQVEPNRPEFFAALAQVYTVMGRSNDAMQAAAKARQMQPQPAR